MLTHLSKFLVKSRCYKSFSSLTALSPLDGRYNKQTTPLQSYFSESALMKLVFFFIFFTKLLRKEIYRHTF